MAKEALGKGLGALISRQISCPDPNEEVGGKIQYVSLSQIISSPLQPRTHFREEKLSELVESIREQGIIQPLIVRFINQKYELIAGERRWRAAQHAGLPEAPVIVRQASDVEVLELALIENLQREELNPIEEARAYIRLANDYGLKQEDISRRVGKRRATVANAMRLLELAPEVQSFLTQGRITVGHAKVLLSFKSHEEQRLLADTIIRKGASVRAAEKLAHAFARQAGKNTGSRKVRPPSLIPAIAHVQNLLQHRLATRIVINHAEKVGTISIEYYGREDLSRILSELGIQEE
ncbi:MAG: transcriptional regulator [Verrucomicrobia bacterium]|nr:MAG: transcriptional regulator [Verrucomicrobiota bacterium]